MKRTLLNIAFCALSLAVAQAQETYENANLVTPELTGTARYVGMGGAMDALGADISTISTNPAGIGLFRSNSVSVSGGLVSQPNGGDTKASFDQIGLVYTHQVNSDSWVNVAFNYHKNRNFNQILAASGALSNASLNKQTFIKGAAGALINDRGDELVTCNRLDALLLDNVLWENAANDYVFKNATGYAFDRSQRGYIGEYDFNISGNIHDRIYLGITMGLHDVHYKAESSYSEQLVANALGLTEYTVDDYRRISGTGFDVKLGVIYRPIEDSPFRLGLALSTPVFYDLKSESITKLGSDRQPSYNEFKVYSPWKLGLSLGHTIGNKVALGAVYEYADYGRTSTRVTDGYRYDWYYGYEYEYTSADREMNDHTKESLKGVSTLKLGVEYKPLPGWSLRAGYNFQSALYDKKAAKGLYKNDDMVWSTGIMTSSTADYTNWDSTNRFTLGLGYNYKKVSFDLAFQHSQTKGDFHPFWSVDYTDESGNAYTNYVDAKSVTNKRNQVLATVAYKF